MDVTLMSVCIVSPGRSIPFALLPIIRALNEQN